MTLEETPAELSCYDRSQCKVVLAELPEGLCTLKLDVDRQQTEIAIPSQWLKKGKRIPVGFILIVVADYSQQCC